MGGYEAGDTVEDARSESNRHKVFFAAARTLLAEVDAQVIYFLFTAVVI